MKIHQHFAGHITKMAAMPIYGKNTLKISFPGTTVQILMKLCMKHQRPKPIIICTNYDPGLTLTYFTHTCDIISDANREIWALKSYFLF